MKVAGVVIVGAVVAACSVQAKQPGVLADAGVDAPAPDARPSAPPETTILEAPPAFSNAAAATFAFTGSVPAATYLCSIDSAAPAPCTSPVIRPLPDGTHSFSVRAVAPGGASDDSPAEHLWTIDTASPTTTLVEAPPAADNSVMVTFRFRASEASVVFECALDSAAYAVCESGEEVGPVGDGAHAFAVRARDRAGNVDASPAVHAWSVDTRTPDTEILTAPAPFVSSTSAAFTFVSPDAGAGARFACAFDGGPFVECTSPHVLAGLVIGAHTLAVRVRDAVGNVDPSPALRRWTIDATAPDTAITSGPAGVVAIASGAFSFTASEVDAEFGCALDGAAPAPCTSPLTLSSLAQGDHALRVVARDLAGNTDPTPALRTWTVDTIAPVVTLVGGPPEGATVGPRVVLGFTTTEGAISCALDGVVLPSCTSPLALNVADGGHALAFTARDAAGNSTVQVRTFVVACGAPDAIGAAALLYLDDGAQDQPNAVAGGAPAVLGDDLTVELGDPATTGGRHGQALAFSADEGDHVSWPVALGDATAMTLELAMLPEVASGAREVVTTGDGRVALRVTAAGATTVVVTLVVLDANDAPIVVSSAPIAAAQWHHVVATWGGAPALGLWVDGVRTDMAGLVLGAPVRLDALRLGGVGGAAYRGAIDEVWVGLAPSEDAFALGRYCPLGG